MEKGKQQGASRIRKLYIAKLIGRCIILGISVFLCWKEAEQFRVLDDFFGKFSLFHILWVLWMVDMLCQLIPVKDRIALGSQKLFEQRFRPIQERGKETPLCRDSEKLLLSERRVDI